MCERVCRWRGPFLPVGRRPSFLELDAPRLSPWDCPRPVARSRLASASRGAVAELEWTAPAAPSGRLSWGTRDSAWFWESLRNSAFHLLLCSQGHCWG